MTSFLRRRRLLAAIVLAGKLTTACATVQSTSPKAAMSIKNELHPLLKDMNEKLKQILEDEKKLDFFLELLRMGFMELEFTFAKHNLNTEQLGVLIGRYFLNLAELENEMLKIRKKFREQPELAAQAEEIYNKVEVKKRENYFSNTVLSILYENTEGRNKIMGYTELQFFFHDFQKSLNIALRTNPDSSFLKEFKEDLRTYSLSIAREKGHVVFYEFFK